MVRFWNADLVMAQWQIYLLYVGIVLFTRMFPFDELQYVQH